jgi:uncharacterized protein (DUF849 family)
LRQAEPGELDGFISADMSAVTNWTVCAFGRRGYDCLVPAIALGGHVRVGLENNLRLRDGSPAPDSAALVAEMADAARAEGRPVASPQAARELLGIGD